MAKKLLVVDSNLAVQKLVQQSLSRDKFDVTCLNDGLSALDLLDKIAPDLILVDYNIEGITIVRFCEKLQQRPSKKERPILLLVSAADRYDPNRLLALGVVDFVKKPLEPRTLIEKLQDLSEETATLIEKAPKPAPMADAAAVASPSSSALPSPPPAGEQAEMALIEEKLGWSLPSDPGRKAAMEPPPMPEDRKSEPDNEQTLFENRAELPAALPPLKSDAAPEFSAVPFFPDEPAVKPSPEEAAPAKSDATAAPVLEYSVTEPAPTTPAEASEPEPQAQPITRQMLETAFPQLYSQPDALNASSKSTTSPSAPGTGNGLTPEEMEALVYKLAREVIEKVAWDVVPTLAETRLKELPASSTTPPKAAPADLQVSPEAIERAIEGLVRKSAKEIIEKIAWEVVPHLTEILIKTELEKLKAEQSS